MTSFPIYVFAGIFGISTLAFLNAQDADMPSLSEATATLVYQDTSYMTRDQQEVWLQDLRTRPGITDELIAVLWEGWKKQRPDVDVFLFVLQHRSDVRPDQIRQIADEVVRLANLSQPSRPRYESAFLANALPLMAIAKEQQTEALAIKLLQSDDRFLDDGILRAMRAIGGRDSLTAISAHVKKRFGPNPERVFEYRAFGEATMAIEARLAVGGSESSTTESTLREQKPAGVKHANPNATQSKETVSSVQSWLIWLVVVILATVGVVWLFLRKSSRGTNRKKGSDENGA